MPRFSNPSLLNVQALFIDNSDSHAQNGAHIRVSHNPLLGLPSMPFILQRADISQQNFKRLPKRTDVVSYHNQYNEELVPPFSINLGDEITVTLPSGPTNMAIWAELIADPSSTPSRPRGRRSSRFPTNFRDISRNIGRLNSAVDLFPTNLKDLRTDIFRDIDLSSRNPQASAIKVTAYMQTVSDNQEYALLGSRNKNPFAFSGTGIKKLVVRGKGTITGIQWINAYEKQSLFKFVTVDILNLPHEGGVRYAHVSKWESLCSTRRDKQAPKRLPLQDTHNAPARFSAPNFSQSKENARVKTLFSGIETPLENLINDPTPQLAQKIKQEILGKDNKNISKDKSATMNIGSLGLMLQSQLDPGVASYMGYKTLDTDHIKSNPEVVQRLSIYRVVGFFNDPSTHKELFKDPLFALLYKQATTLGSRTTTDKAISQFEGTAGTYLKSKNINIKYTTQEKNSIILQGIAVADHMSVLDEVNPVSLDKPCHLNWIPSKINTPIRSIETEISNLVATAGLAVKLRQTQNSNNWQNKNSVLGKVPNAWHALSIAGIYKLKPGDRLNACKEKQSETNQEIQENFIADSSVGADNFRQYVAQMDRFGRFSEWASVVGDKGLRPVPPRPTVIATYKQPDPTNESEKCLPELNPDKHQGCITVTVPLPEDDALAPASFPLSHVELTVRSNNAPFGSLLTILVTEKISIHPEPPITPEPPPEPPLEPRNDQFGLRITFLGPIIPTTLSRDLEVTAVWVDTQGQRSDVSEPAKLMMHDPYPPVQMPIPDVLEYAARPDATKKSWVERRWETAGSNVQYAIYYTDENRLRDYLRTESKEGEAWASSLLEDLENETDLAARASMLKVENARFPDYLYERLKDVLATDIAPGFTGFRHALSGSLRTLSAYKIVAESVNTAARPKLSDVDIVFYGVPNSDPPARPSITAKLLPPTGDPLKYVVELTITLRPGVTQGELARIRRTRSGVIDPLSNPIVDTANFGPIDPTTGLQTARLKDTGSALIAPNAQFSPFVNYAWIVEAQGIPEVGSASSIAGAVAGLWSRPSAPVNLDILPQNIPAPPIFETQNGNIETLGIRNLALTFSYPVNLVPTSLGAWVIRVERIFPNEAMTLLSEEDAETGITFVVLGDMTDPSLLIPHGTKYRVRIIDPIGRECIAVEHTIL